MTCTAVARLASGFAVPARSRCSCHLWWDATTARRLRSQSRSLWQRVLYRGCCAIVMGCPMRWGDIDGDCLRDCVDGEGVTKEQKGWSLEVVTRGQIEGMRWPSRQARSIRVASHPQSLKSKAWRSCNPPSTAISLVNITLQTINSIDM
jgi:hypothetical protein